MCSDRGKASQLAVLRHAVSSHSTLAVHPSLLCARSPLPAELSPSAALLIGLAPNGAAADTAAAAAPCGCTPALQPRAELVHIGEPAELLVLCKDDAFVTFKVRRLPTVLLAARQPMKSAVRKYTSDFHVHVHVTWC